jgi:hypothetical protein
MNQFHWGGYEPDTTLFARGAGGNSEYRLRLRGVDAGADYEVALDNVSQVFRMFGLRIEGRIDAV